MRFDEVCSTKPVVYNTSTGTWEREMIIVIVCMYKYCTYILGHKSTVAVTNAEF